MARSRRAHRSPRRGRIQLHPHGSVRRPSGTPTTGSAPRVPSSEQLADELLRHAVAESRPVRLLRDLAARPDGIEVVDRLVHATLDAVWSRGWQPRDIVHLARKRSAREAGFATAAIAAQSMAYVDDPAIEPEWRAQLVELGVIDERGRPTALARRVDGGAADTLAWLDASFELMGWLRHLPPIPPVGGRPGAWNTVVGARRAPRRSSDPVIAKVRALLAKAESTDFPEEAETFSAKAQELITRNAIDRALVDAGGEADEAPIARRVPVDDPHAQAKVHLLGQVALANRCQAVWVGGYGLATVIGFADDVDNVELLFASLLVQANRTLAALARTAPPGAHQRSTRFRRGFLHGYASEIGERLRDTAAHTTAQASDTHGDALLPVLARRDEAVTAARDRLFPHVVARRARPADYEGWLAGSAAGRLASLALDGDVAPPLPS